TVLSEPSDFQPALTVLVVRKLSVAGKVFHQHCTPFAPNAEAVGVSREANLHCTAAAAEAWRKASRCVACGVATRRALCNGILHFRARVPDIPGAKRSAKVPETTCT